MRRFAILVTVCGACCSSWATAAPFDQLSSRLQQYDDSAAESRQPSRRGSYASPSRYADSDVEPRQAPRRGGYVSQQRYDEPEVEPRQAPRRGSNASHQEFVPAEGDQEPWQDDGGWDGPCDDCCSGDWCNSGPCSGRGFWGRAEYLYWWVRGSNTPPLLTTSPDNTPQANAGILPDATVLFGDQRLNRTGRSGGRFTLGYGWDSCCASMGLEGSFLFLGNVTQNFVASSGGSPILARPFFNVQSGQQDADLLAFPNVVVGSFNAASTSRLLGFEVNLRRSIYNDCWRHVDVLAGYRFLQLNEGLQITTNTTSTDPDSPIEVGTAFAIRDSFNTRNSFNGGQLGLNWQYTDCRWTLDLLAKLALGGVSQQVSINGGTVVTPPGGAPISGTGGILALNTNTGTYNRNRFAVLPEFGANLKYQLTPCWRVNLGYTLLVLTNVARPGDQIDLQVDPNQFPPPIGTGTFPKFAFHDSDVWIQGINVGLECNF